MRIVVHPEPRLERGTDVLVEMLDVGALIARRYPPDAAPALLASPASGIESVVSFAEAG